MTRASVDCYCPEVAHRRQRGARKAGRVPASSVSNGGPVLWWLSYPKCQIVLATIMPDQILQNRSGQSRHGNTGDSAFSTLAALGQKTPGHQLFVTGAYRVLLFSSIRSTDTRPGVFCRPPLEAQRYGCSCIGSRLDNRSLLEPNRFWGNPSAGRPDW